MRSSCSLRLGWPMVTQYTHTALLLHQRTQYFCHSIYIARNDSGTCLSLAFLLNNLVVASEPCPAMTQNFVKLRCVAFTMDLRHRTLQIRPTMFTHTKTTSSTERTRQSTKALPFKCCGQRLSSMSFVRPFQAIQAGPLMLSLMS